MDCTYDREYKDSILQNYTETCLQNSVTNVAGTQRYDNILKYDIYVILLKREN